MKRPVAASPFPAPPSLARAESPAELCPLRGLEL